MPTKRNAKKVYPRRRRFYKRRPRKPKTKNNQITLIRNPTIGGFPKSVFTRLKYQLSGVLNPGVGGVNAVQVFRANSIYDSDATGAGAQCRGHDEWATIYDHYYVKRSKIVIEFHNGDNSYEVQVGCAIRDDNTTETNPLDYAEQDAVFGMLGRVGSSHNHKVITRYFDYQKYNHAKYMTSQNKGIMNSTNPAEQHYFHIYAGSPWGQDPANTYYTATIWYDVLLTELKDITQS